MTTQNDQRTEPSRKTCSRCGRLLPRSMFRWRQMGKSLHAACRECNRVDVARRRVIRRNDELAAASQFHNLLAYRGKERQLVGAVSAIIERFGGAASFAERWHGALQAAQRSGKHYLVMRFFREVAWLIRFRDEILRRLEAEAAAMDGDLDDDDLERAMERLASEWIIANPEKAMALSRNELEMRE